MKGSQLKALINNNIQDDEHIEEFQMHLTVVIDARLGITCTKTLSTETATTREPADQHP